MAKKRSFKELSLSERFRKKQKAAETAGVKVGEKDLVTEKKAERIAKKARKVQQQNRQQKRRQKRTAQYRKKMFGNLLLKAGFMVKPERVQRFVFYFSIAVLGLFTFLTMIIAAIARKAAGKLLLFYLGLWTGVFAFVYLFTLMVIYLYLDIRIYKRTKELEDVLPDFLQLASANISAGMPIDRALWFAVRPNFGVLAKEIEEVAKSTLAGEELSESLIQFTERYDSIMLKRSINILLEGLAAGGEMADLLNKIALDIQETKILRKEMSANVATYAIFITFASIIIAPALFALATQLLTIIVSITSTLDLSGMSNSFLRLNIQTDPKMISDFRIFCYAMLSIGSLMSASIVSVIRKGRVKDGLRNLPIFWATSIFIYMVTSSVLNGLLGSLF